MRYKGKAQKVISEITAHLIRNDTEITPSINLKLSLLENSLIDYFNANGYIKTNGYIQQFNKGTSIGLSPMLKLKNESLKNILRIIKDLKIPNEDGEESAQEFIERLVS